MNKKPTLQEKYSSINAYLPHRYAKTIEQRMKGKYNLHQIRRVRNNRNLEPYPDLVNELYKLAMKTKKTKNK